MAMSIDGKIATADRGPVKLGSAADTRRMSVIRAAHDVVINGSSTFRAYPKPLKVVGEDLIRERLESGKPAQPISAVVSSSLDIPLHTPWEKAIEAERWIFCGKKAPQKKIAALKKAGIHVVQSKKDRPDPEEILTAFAKKGCQSVLVEGGGEFNASFLEKNLVNCLYLTIAPILIGGVNSPTIFEGKGFSRGKFSRFKLIDCQNLEGELFLTYER
jgi:riboflavin-specific deaminase-like protein